MAVNFFPDSDTGGGVVSGDYIPLTQRGSANGVATLDSSAKVPQSQLPNISITDTFVVDSQTEMLALVAQTGDIAVRTDNNKTFILKSSPATSLANWIELPTPTNGVFSVDGKTGAVILSSDYQAKSNELTSLSALSDSPGFIKKISDGVYAIDGSSYLTTTLATTSYQPLNDGLTRISGLTPDGFLIKVGGIWGMDTNSYQIQDGDLTAIASLATTGYLERTGTNTWRTVSGPFQPLDADLTDIASLTGNGIIRKTAGVWGLDTTNYQIANNELSGFSALPDIQGFVRKVGDGSYTLDSNTYLTTASATSSYQPLNTNLTGISGLVGTTGTPKMTDGVWVLDATAYLTGNQTITLSGDISGSGTTSITATLPNIVTAGSNTKINYNAKGLITGGSALIASDIPGGIDWSKITTTPTTLSGYGITDPLVTLDTVQTVTGTKTFTGAITGSRNSVQFVLNQSGVTQPTALLSNQSGLFYFFCSDASASVNTTINALRPLTINLTSGLLSSANGQNFAGGMASPGSITVTNATPSTSTTTGAITSVGGISSQGAMYASSFNGSGSGLTSLNASNLSSGTIPDARLAGNYMGLTSIAGSGNCSFGAFYVNNTASWDTSAGRIMSVSNRLQLVGIPASDGATRMIEFVGAIQNGITLASGTTNKVVVFSSLVGGVSVSRWIISSDPVSNETGANAGSDFIIGCYDDGGAWLGGAFSIKRSTKDVSILSTTASTSTTTGALRVTGGIASQGTVTANLLSGLIQLRTLTSATRPVPSTTTEGQVWYNLDTKNIEFATNTAVKVVTSA